jgi:hypothetical protein
MRSSPAVMARRMLDTLGVRLVGGAPPLDQYRLVADGQRHLLPLSPQGIAATTYLDAAEKAQLGGVFDRVSTLVPRELQGLSVETFVANLELRPRVEALLGRCSACRLRRRSRRVRCRCGHRAAAGRRAVGVLYLDGGWAQLTAALRSTRGVRPNSAVRAVTADRYGAAVHTDDGVYTASTVVLAAGNPAAARAVLASEPDWGDLGDPSHRRLPRCRRHARAHAGYVVSVDEPLYGTVQSPPRSRRQRGER